MPRSCRHVLVAGRVQGVAFRWAARERALALGLVGWVRNLSDGRVEARVEGEGPDVEAMVAWLRKGPPGARVRGVEVRACDARGAQGFEILRSAVGG